MGIKITGKGTVKGTCPSCGKPVTGMTVNRYNAHLERCGGA